MTIVRSAAPTGVSADADGGGPGERLRRLRQRRRLVREEILAVAILVIALATTLVVLGLQWLGSGQSVTTSTGPARAYNIMGGPS
jgi:ferric-dicitrate binding protein FerR (iron transport regulator)